MKLNLMSIAFTMGAILIGHWPVVAVGVVPAVLAFLYLDTWTETLVNLARWPAPPALVGCDTHGNIADLPLRAEL